MSEVLKSPVLNMLITFSNQLWHFSVHTSLCCYNIQALEA